MQNGIKVTLVNFAYIGNKGWILALAEIGEKKKVKVCTWAGLSGGKISPLYKGKDAED